MERMRSASPDHRLEGVVDVALTWSWTLTAMAFYSSDLPERDRVAAQQLRDR
jgi:hypothetical protein